MNGDSNQSKKRVLGLDWGEKRIGAAMSDPDGKVAVPLGAWTCPGTKSLMSNIEKAVAEYGIGAVVLGLPLGLDGKERPGSQKVRELAEKIKQRFPGLDVMLQDERLTTAQADRQRIAAGGKKFKSKGDRDAAAAAIILQTFLDQTTRLD